MSKHSWMKEEDATLVECLVELMNADGLGSDNGTFRLGYLSHLTRMMACKSPGRNIQATTIDSRIKLLKKMFHAIAEMRGSSCNGFGWNDELKCIVEEKDVFDVGQGTILFMSSVIVVQVTIILTMFFVLKQSHPAVKGLLHRSFSHYNELSYVFGKDRATGSRSEIFADIGLNVPGGYKRFSIDDVNDIEFHTTYSQGLNMSSDEVMGT